MCFVYRRFVLQFRDSVYGLLTTGRAPLDACKERDLLKQALLSENGILRNLHFLEPNEVEDVLKTVAERRSGSAEDNQDEDDDVYDEFLLLADVYYGSKVERRDWVAIEAW